MNTDNHTVSKKIIAMFDKLNPPWETGVGLGVFVDLAMRCKMPQRKRLGSSLSRLSVLLAAVTTALFCAEFAGAQIAGRVAGKAGVSMPGRAAEADNHSRVLHGVVGEEQLGADGADAGPQCVAHEPVEPVRAHGLDIVIQQQQQLTGDAADGAEEHVGEDDGRARGERGGEDPAGRPAG